MQIIHLNSTENIIAGGYNAGDTVTCLCDCTNGSFAPLLPDAPGVHNAIFYFKKTDSSVNTVTITPINTQTIDGESTVVLNLQNAGISIASDNSNWVILPNQIKFNEVLQATDLILTNFASGNETIDEILDDTINPGILDAITITDEGGINISWTAGEVWDYDNCDIVVTDASGAVACTDNVNNYLYWDRSGGGTALTLSTVRWDINDNDIPIAIISVQNADIWGIQQVDLLNTSSYRTTNAIEEILKVVVTEGLVVSEDVNVVNDLDVQISAGTFYNFGNARYNLAAGFNTRTTAMTRWFHTGGAWDYDSNAEIDPTQYDDLTDLAATNAAKYYKSVFMYSENMIHWMYPQVAYNTLAQAIAAPLPIIPAVGTHYPYSVAVVMKGNDTTFPTAGGERWIDVRPQFGTSIAGSISDHSSLVKLNWADAGHTFDAAVDFNAQNISNIGTVGCGAITSTGVITGNSFVTASDIGVAGDTDAITIAAGGDVTVTQQAIVTGNLQLVSGYIYPDVDAVNSIRVTKADGVTGVMLIDTTNRRVEVGGTAVASKTFQVDGSMGVYGGNLIMNKLSAADFDADVTGYSGTPPFGMICNASTAWPFVMVATQNNANGPLIGAFKSRSSGTGGDANRIVQVGDVVLGFSGLGADGAAYKTAGLLRLNVESGIASGRCPGGWNFWATNSSGTLATRMTISGQNGILAEIPIKIKEAAAAIADSAGYGQLWVKNTTPCELWFTDDAGTDSQIC